MTRIQNMLTRQIKHGCLCGALLLSVCLSAAAGPAENIPAIPAPVLYPDTALVADGRAVCAIVYPAAAPDYARAAHDLAADMQARYGIAIPLLTDEAVCPRKLAPILPEYRSQNLILLGNVHNNRALLQLYAGFWCGADGVYPGGDGYEVRTVSNPWGTGKNAIILGASSPAGAASAAAALMEILPAMADDRAVLPHLLIVQPGGAVKNILDGLAEKVADYKIDYDWLIANMNAEPVDFFSMMAFRYHWSGDRRWAEIARKVMLCIDEHYNHKYYSVSHYRFERFFRAWDIIEETGVFTEEERHRISRRMVETAFRAPSCQLYAARQSGGDRHHTALWMSAYIASDYILRNIPDAPELREIAEQWHQAADATFRFAVTGGRDDSDRYSSQDTVEMFMRWSLLSGCFDFFDSGMARQGFVFFLNYFNPLGFACGMADYQEGTPESMYDASHGLRYHCNLLEYVYDDSRFAWLKEHAAVCRRGRTYFGPNELAPENEGHFEPETAAAAKTAETPAYLLGMTALSLDQRLYSFHFPKPDPRVPLGQAADKIYFRSGFAPDDQYLVLQCLQSRNDANCIPQYVDKGQIWLFHNTNERGTFYRNGVFVSDGVNPPASNSVFACRTDNLARFSSLEISRTTLLEYMGADWTRTIIRLPRAWFLVMDHVAPLMADDYTIICSWRLLHHAEWRDDCNLVAHAGGAEFHLRSAAPVVASTEQWEQLESSACPFFLRQIRAGSFPAGQAVDFHNLLFVRGPDDASDFTPVRIDAWTVLIKSAGQGAALAGIGTGASNALGITANPGCVYVITPDRLYLSNGSYLSIQSAVLYAAETAQTVEIDLQTNDSQFGADAAELFAAARTWELPAPRKAPDSLKIDPSRAAALCRQVLAVPAVPAAYADSGAGLVDVPAQTAPGFKIIAANPDACRAPRKIPGVVFSSAEIEGQPAIAVDGIKEPVTRGRLSWPAGVRPKMQLRLPASQALAKMLVYFYGRIPNLPASERFSVKIEDGEDGSADRSEFDAPCEYFPVYKISNKGKAASLSCLSVDLNGVASSNLLVSLPFNAPAYYLCLKEVELYGREFTGAMIDQASAADLDGDGRLEIIVTYKNEAGTGVLKVFDGDGRELWSKSARGAFSCAVAGDVTGDGREEIMAVSDDYRVWLWAADGTLIWEKNLESLGEQSGKKHWFYGSVATGIGLWTPAPDKKFIIVGGYCHFALLDAEGNIRDNCPIDGRYVRAILQKQPDLQGEGRRAAFLLQQYNNSCPGDVNIIQMDAAEKLSAFSYRALIPDGRFAADLTDENPPRLSAIGPRGFGFYKTDTSLKGIEIYSIVLWSQLYTRPITAGALVDLNGDGKKDFLVGGADGFISAFNRDDGQLLGQTALGKPVVDMLGYESASGPLLIVATDTDLRAYDANMQLMARTSLACSKLVALSPEENSFVAFDRSGGLNIVKLEK